MQRVVDSAGSVSVRGFQRSKLAREVRIRTKVLGQITLAVSRCEEKTMTEKTRQDEHSGSPAGYPSLSRYKARDRTYAVMAAWMAGEMSEGQAAKLIGHDCLELREHRDELLAVASELWERFRHAGTTVSDDLTHEVRTEQRHCCRCDD